jgi:hypothetical protein
MKSPLTNEEYLDRLRNDVLDVVCQYELWIEISGFLTSRSRFEMHLTHSNEFRILTNALVSELIITICALLESREDTVNFSGLVQRHPNTLSANFGDLVSHTMRANFVKKCFSVRSNVLAHRSNRKLNTWHALRPTRREIWLAITRLLCLYRQACKQLRGYDPPVLKNINQRERENARRFVAKLIMRS